VNFRAVSCMDELAIRILFIRIKRSISAEFVVSVLASSFAVYRKEDAINILFHLIHKFLTDEIIFFQKSQTWVCSRNILKLCKFQPRYSYTRNSYHYSCPRC